MKRPGGFDDAASEREEPQQDPSARKKSWFGFGSHDAVEPASEAELPPAGASARSARAIADSQLYRQTVQGSPLIGEEDEHDHTVASAAVQGSRSAQAHEDAAFAASIDDPVASSDGTDVSEATPDAASDAEDMTATAAVLPLRRASALRSLKDRPEPEVDPVREAEARLKQAGRDRRHREQRERRRFTEHLRVRRRRALIAFGAVAALALFVIAGVFTPIMAVRDVQLRGAQALNVDELQQSLSRFQGVPLALVTDQDVHRAIEAFPLVQRYSIERIPPHTLIVTVEERIAAVALEREGGFDLLDPAGVLLGRVPERPAGVPLGSAELTDTSSPAFAAATGVVRDMPEDIRAQLETVRASNAQNVTFTLVGGTEVLWGESKETQRKAVVLRSLLASIGPVSMIDVSAPDAPVFK